MVANAGARIDVMPLTDALRPALLRISRLMKREAQRAGVSALDAHLLSAVKKNAGIRAGVLAEREQMSAASMSVHVKRLEQAGWIERSTSGGEDRRSLGMSITDQGSKMLDLIRRSRSEWLAARLAELTDDERAALASAAAPLMRLAADR